MECVACNKKRASWYCEGVLPQETVGKDNGLRENGISQAPAVYEGDIILDQNHHCSAVVTIPDGRIVMICPTNPTVAAANRNNNGLLYIIADNTHWASYEVPLGHANGATWDNKRGKLLITPLFDYSGGLTNQSWPCVIEFNLEDITHPTYVTTPYNFMSIGYNYIDGITYLTRWGGGDIYTYDGRNCDYYITITKPSGTRSYNQGFAVNGDYCYISDSNNYFGCYNLRTGDHVKEFFVTQYDSQGWYNLGELEDFDFDKDGNLFAARYTYLSGYHTDAFYSYIPLEAYKVDPAYQGYGLKNWTFSINNTTIGTFKNSFTTMKHLEQLNMFCGNNAMVKSVNCNFTVDIGEVDLGVDIVINLTNLKCKWLHTTGKLIISSATADNLCAFTATGGAKPLAVLRNGSLKLLNTEGTLKFTTTYDALDIRIDTFIPHIDIRANILVNGTSTYSSSTVFTIGEVSPGNDIRGVYVGKTRIYQFTD